MVLSGLPKPQIPFVIHWSFVLFVFTIPFEAADLGFTSSNFTVAKLAGGLFFALYFIRYNPLLLCYSPSRQSLPAPPRAVWWFLGYMIIYTLNGFFLPEPLLSELFSPLFTLLQLIVLFWVATNLFKVEKITRHALLAYCVASAILALGMLLHLPGFTESMQAAGVERQTALGYNPNKVASLWGLAVLSLTGLCLRMVYNAFIRLLLGMLTVPMLVGMVNTGSLAGIGALMIGFGVYLLPYWRSRGRLTATLLAILGIAATIYLVMHAPAADRWKGVSEGNLAGREEIYPAVIAMSLERPFLGWKPLMSSYELGRRVYGLHTPSERDAHNLLLYLFSEGGIVGTLPFLVGLWLCGKSAWQGRSKPLGLLPLALLCAVLASSMAHTDLRRKPFWLVLALASAATPLTAGDTTQHKMLLIRRPARHET
jgi:O-antigen ligase